MGEFYYYGTQKDVEDLVKSLVEQIEIEFIPSLNYPEKHVFRFHEFSDQLKKLIKERVKFFLWNKDMYSYFPLNYWCCESGEVEGTYQIVESPSLSMTLPSYIENNDNERLRCVCGIIAHSKQLYDRETDEIIPVQKKVSEAYKKVIKVVKGNLIKVKNKDLWLGREALELFSEGRMEVIYDGEWITGK